ncbi:MAG: aldo/keto reductase, partial [Gammaproteobacteria bacterium]
MAPLGLGCAAIGNLYSRISDATAEAALAAAWQGGIRFFDTAPYYGHGLSESRLGKFLSKIRDHDAVVSTKVGRSLRPVSPEAVPDHGFVDPMPYQPYFDYSGDAVRDQVRASQARLGIDRFAMLLLHDIGVLTHGAAHEAVMRTALQQALPALNEFKLAGVTQAVGIGVNEVDVCLQVLADADIDVILLAGRYTLLEQGALNALLPACQRRSISVVIGGPYNSGLLAGGQHYDYGAVPAAVRERVLRISTICREHDVPVAAAALQFPLAHPSVAAVIPGARSPAEV